MLRPGLGAGREGRSQGPPSCPLRAAGPSPGLGRFQDADSALAAHLRGLGRAPAAPQRRAHSLIKVRLRQAAGAGSGPRGPQGPLQAGGARPGVAVPGAEGGSARTRVSGIGCNRWGRPGAANGRSSPPLLFPSFHLLPPRRPPPRRSWQRRAAGWSRRRSPSTAAATWCRGRSTASSPSSSSTSGACRSARRCGRAWPRAAGSSRGGRGAGLSEAGNPGAPTRGRARRRSVGCCAALQGRPGFGQLTDSGLPGGRVALSFSARIDPSLGSSSLERVCSGSRISFSSLEGT